MYNEIGLLLNAFLLGTMISFMVITSPTVFKTLDGEHSKRFLRVIFPRLFNFCFVISVFLCLFFLIGGFLYGTFVGIFIGISFLINTYILTPLINKMRDSSILGNKTSEKSFKLLHLVSVLLYLLNLLFSASVLIFYYLN